MALTEADLTAAAARLYTDADAVIVLLQGKKAQLDTVAEAIARDLEATRAAADRAEAAASSVGGGTNGVVIAAEGENFTVPDNTVVRFGVGDKWVEGVFSGAHVCNLPTFGTDVDPAVGQVKQCVLGHYVP